MPHGSHSTIMQAGGVSIGRPIVREADQLHHLELALPAGADGELTTRTSASVGTATMDAAGHGLATGATVCVFWTGGRRYNVTLGTVAGTSVPFSGGSGDDLPATTTGLTITTVVQASFPLEGAALHLVGLELQRADATDPSQAHARFMDSSSTQVGQLTFDPHTPQIYDMDRGDTNPLQGTIAAVVAANGSGSQAATLAILALADTTTTTTTTTAAP